VDSHHLMLRRATAAMIDYGLYFVILYVYFRLFGIENADGTIELHGFLHLTMLALIWIALFPFMEDWFGYTLGKGLLDLKVISIAINKRITFGATLKRHLLDPIDVLAALIIVVVVWRSETPRRLGDLWGKTKVVRIG